MREPVDTERQGGERGRRGGEKERLPFCPELGEPVLEGRRMGMNHLAVKVPGQVGGELFGRRISSSRIFFEAFLDDRFLVTFDPRIGFSERFRFDLENHPKEFVDVVRLEGHPVCQERVERGS